MWELFVYGDGKKKMMHKKDKSQNLVKIYIFAS